MAATNISSQDLVKEISPTDSDRSVVFRGDGEPKTPEQLVEQLTAIQAHEGFEADSYTLGGTVQALEERFAEELGKERAIFMPTGTLANHLAIRKLCGLAPRAVVQEQSHLYHDTGDCVTQLSSINLVPLAKNKPYFTLDELKKAVIDSETGRVLNPVGAVMIEGPVRRQMGQIMPLDEMQRVTEFCKENGIGTHLDGARLYMMSAATGISVKEYSRLFDTVYVSLYKYFGAPFGAILAGTSEFCEGMYHMRRMFGGGLASSYIAAGIALRNLEGFEAKFSEVIQKARDLFSSINTLDGVRIDEFENGSNIFPLTLDSNVDEERFVSELNSHSIFVYPDENATSLSRLTVNTTILRQSTDEIYEAFKEALNNSTS